MSAYAPGAWKVRCRSCQWRGDRHPRLDGPRWGTCPKCEAILERARTLADKQAAKAKAELQDLEAHAWRT